METYHCDTVIVGAGFAGVAAAREFEEHNRSGGKPTKYVVLEAKDKIGGRVESQVISFHDQPIIINPGAQWIHRDLRKGSPENRLLKIAQESEDLLRRDPMEREFWVHGQRKTHKLATKKVDKARALIDNYQGPDVNLEKLFLESGLDISGELTTTYGEAETGAPLSQVSTKDLQDCVACNMGDFTRRGVGKMFEYFAKPVRQHVKTSSPVKRIEWPENGQGKVKVYTDSAVYETEHVLISVSVGVLKSGAIEFVPPLPKQFQDDLKNIWMGDINKIFLGIKPGCKLPVGANTHMDVRTKDGHDIFYLARDNAQPLIMVYLGGEQARICGDTPDIMVARTMDGLREIFGKEVTKNIEPIHITKWGSDPFVRGGYSRVSVGHHDVREKLATPVAGKISFMGEAIGARDPESGRNWATHMTGAMLSGQRAAKAVLAQYQSPSHPRVADYSATQGRAV